MWRSLILLLTPSIAFAFGDVEHKTDIHHSEWEYAGTPTECLLMHKISGYGNAWFIHRAGREPLLEIEVNQRYQNEGIASIKESPPAWIHNPASSRVEEVAIKKGSKPFVISSPQSLWMLETLQKGWVAQVEHANWGRKESSVRVSINPVNFQKPFRSFQECIKQLLPYTFEEVRRHTFYLGTKQTGLSKEMHEALDKIAVFLNASPSQYKVTVEAHTDNVGRRSANQRLSAKRAKSMADYLISKGVEKASISAKGYGESRPKASNRRKKGRALNRRVEVRLVEAKK
ncbi:MAG: OmpA family protein [Candidatus Sedimenticola sp. (ex Thyasira tokunagai)]